VIVSIYVPNVSALNFIKQTPRDIKEQLSPDRIVVGDFHTTLSDRTGKNLCNYSSDKE
jgi:hypothetical protein